MKGERELIARILGRPAAVDDPDGAFPSVLLGPGDDAGVVSRGDGDLVVSTDLSVEGVHFRLDWITAAEAGSRAAAAALSDLAAMGAAPRAILFSLAGCDPDCITSAGIAARELADRLGIPVLGGDISRAPVLTMDMVVIGETSAPLRRSGAEVDQEVWVTGALGGPAAALSSWQGGGQPLPAARLRFVSPAPRLSEMLWLKGASEISAAIDLSDGLLRDAERLAAASGLGLDLEADLIPVHPAAMEGRGLGEARGLAMRGGEEYEILFTSPALTAAIVREFTERFGLELTRVGRTRTGSGVSLDGVMTDAAGFDHFEHTE